MVRGLLELLATSIRKYIYKLDDGAGIADEYIINDWTESRDLSLKMLEQFDGRFEDFINFGI